MCKQVCITMSRDPNNLIWVDLEMTGLDVAESTIIEIAIVITDKDLKVLDRWPEGETGQAIYQPASVLEAINDPWVRENLTDLMQRVRSSSADLVAAEEQALAFVGSYCPAPGKNRKEGCPLAGNSIGQDRAFLQRYMPRLERYTHFRNVDVTTIKELVKRWYPEHRYEKAETDEHGVAIRHSAMKDILDSIEELRYYRSQIFVS
jgi:oligoribonuclease